MTLKIVILWVGKAEFTRIYTIFRHTHGCITASWSCKDIDLMEKSLEKI